MELHNVPCNGEAEPETRLALVYRTIPLAIPLEDVRQDIGRDSFSRIPDAYFRLFPDRGDIDVHLAAFPSEFDGVGQDIANDLLQTREVSAHGNRARLHDELHLDFFARRLRKDHLEGVAHHTSQIQ